MPSARQIADKLYGRSPAKKAIMKRSDALRRKIYAATPAHSGNLSHVQKKIDKKAHSFFAKIEELRKEVEPHTIPNDIAWRFYDKDRDEVVHDLVFHANPYTFQRLRNMCEMISGAASRGNL